MGRSSELLPSNRPHQAVQASQQRLMSLQSIIEKKFHFKQKVINFKEKNYFNVPRFYIDLSQKAITQFHMFLSPFTYGILAQILPTLTFLLYSLDCLHDNGTGPDLSCSSVYFYFFFFYIFVLSVW